MRIHPEKIRSRTAVLVVCALLAPLGGCMGGRASSASAGAPAASEPASERDLSGFLDVEVATVGLDVQHGQPLALLHANWESVLPVWIGNAEALAIARARSGMVMPRPLTHDLFVHVLEDLGGTLEEVLVHDMRENLYYGLLRIRLDDRIREVDSRPSDALALAVRTGARIRIDPALLAAAPDVDFISMEGERPIVRMRGITVQDASLDDRVAFDPPADLTGVVVLHTDGVATSRAVHAGDLIRRVNGRGVDSPTSFMQVVQEVPRDAGLEIDLVRDGEPLQVGVPSRAAPSRRS